MSNKEVRKVQDQLDAANDTIVATEDMLEIANKEIAALHAEIDDVHARLDKLPTWDELTDAQRPITPTERLLMMCLATVSTHPNYSHKTPWDVYDTMVAHEREAREGELAEADPVVTD